MTLNSILRVFQTMSKNLDLMKELYQSFNMIDKFKEIISKYYNIVIQKFNLTDDDVNYLVNLVYDDNFMITNLTEVNDSIQTLIKSKIIFSIDNKNYLVNLIVYNICKLYKELENVDNVNVVDMNNNTSNIQVDKIEDIDVDKLLLQQVKENLEEMRKKKKEVQNKIEQIVNPELSEEDFQYQNIDYDRELDEETRKIFEELQSQ